LRHAWRAAVAIVNAAKFAYQRDARRGGIARQRGLNALR